MATVQIPVLFDMSGDTVVFGEETAGDFITSHLDFLLDMTTEANGVSLTAADISSSILIGDNDSADSIFYSAGVVPDASGNGSGGNVKIDELCNKISNAITRGKLVHTPKYGNTANSGIPMGGRFKLYDENGVFQANTNLDKYAIKYNTSVAPIGDEQMLGEAMARVASIHLVGSPLAAGIFTNQNEVQTDLETASTQTFNSGGTAFYNALAVQLSKVLGGSKSTTPMNPGEKLIVYPNTTLDAFNEKIDFKDSVVEWETTCTIRYKVINSATTAGTPGTYQIKIYPIFDDQGGYNTDRVFWPSQMPNIGYGGPSYEFWLDDASLLADSVNSLVIKDLQFTNTTWANRDANNAGPLAANVVHNGIANGSPGSKMTWTPTAIGEYIRFFDAANPGWGQFQSGGPTIVYNKHLAGAAKFACALDSTTQTNNWKQNSASALGPFPGMHPGGYAQYDPSNNDGSVYNQQTTNMTYDDQWNWANTDPSGFVFHMKDAGLQFQFMVKPGNGSPVGGFRGLQIEFVLPNTVSIAPLVSTLSEDCGNDISNTQFVYTYNSKWAVADHNNYKLPAFVWVVADSYIPYDMTSSTYNETNSYKLGPSGYASRYGKCSSITMVWEEQFNPGAMVFGGSQYGGIKKINYFQTTDISNMNQLNLLSSSFGYTQKFVSPLLPNDINYLKFGLPQGTNTARHTSFAGVGSLMGPFVYTASSDVKDVAKAFGLEGEAATTRSIYDYAAFDHTSATTGGVWDLTPWGTGGTKNAINYANYGKYLGTDGPTNGVAGPYIQIDLGVSTLVRFAFCMTYYVDRLVVFGSNDASTWTLLRDYDDMAGFRFDNNGRKMPTGMWGNPNIELNHNDVNYRHLRFVVNRGGAGIIGGLGGKQEPRIYETYVYGIDPTYPPQLADEFFPLDASGVANPALKSIYEQLMNVPGRSQIMQTRDIAGVGGNSNITLAGGFPFITGDKLVMYLRPKIVFGANTSPEQFNTLYGFAPNLSLGAPAADIGLQSGSGGGTTGQTYSTSSQNSATYAVEKLFEYKNNN